MVRGREFSAGMASAGALGIYCDPMLKPEAVIGISIRGRGFRQMVPAGGSWLTDGQPVISLPFCRPGAAAGGLN